MFKIKCKTNDRYRLFIEILCIMLLLAKFPIYISAAELNTESDRVIVSIGDSYSSGESIEPFYDQNLLLKQRVQSDDWLAHRSEKSWPGMLTLPGVNGTMAENRGTHWYFAAVSGATTADIITTEYSNSKEYKEYNQSLTKKQKKIWKIMEKKYYKYLPQLSTIVVQPHLSGKKDVSFQLDIFEELEKKNQKADYVTVTIGGNDVGFADIILKMVVNPSYLDISGLYKQIESVKKDIQEDGWIYKNICDAYVRISEAAGPQAKIIVAGYPRLFDRKGSEVLIGEDEVKLVNQAVFTLNEVLYSMVEKVKSSGIDIYFVPVDEEFQGHRAYASNPYINKVILLKQEQDLDDRVFPPGSAYSIHPNYEGAKVYAKCVQEQIDILEGIKTVYLENFNLLTFRYDGELCDNYKIRIEGKKKVPTLFTETVYSEELKMDIDISNFKEEDYYEEISVNEPRAIPIILDAGDYTITVTDGKSSYSQNIKIQLKDVQSHIGNLTNQNNKEKRELIFNTDFGSVNKNNDIEEQDKEIDIPQDAISYNGHWYKVIQDNSISTWQEAKEYCESQNGYLATITTQDENDFLYSYITKQGHSSAYFGFSDVNSEGNWIWENGENVIYTNWHSGEPNSENSDEDYAMFYNKFTDGTWNDGKFGDISVFICEWDEYKSSSEIENTNPISSSQLVGKWEIDATKTMEENGISMKELFGSGYSQYGAEMEVGEDNTFSYWIGIGNGGKGTYEIEEEYLKYQVTTYEESSNETNSIKIVYREDKKILYLIQEYFDEYQLYWVKK